MLTVPPASPSLSDTAKTKRDTGVLKCSVGGGGETGEKQAGRWSESSPVGEKHTKSTFHLQSKVVKVMVQEVSTKRTQLKNNMDSKRKKKKKDRRGWVDG